MTEQQRERRREYMREYNRKWRAANPDYARKWCVANPGKVKAKTREHYSAHRGKILQKAREYGAANRDRISEKNRRYHHANRDRLLAYDKAYRAANRERLSQAMKEYRAADPARTVEQSREHNLRRKGFTAQLKDETAAAQGHCCAICGTDLRVLPIRHVHADHCHKTRKPRGVLCHWCNTGLGVFRDDPERLQAAIAYLKNPPLWQTDEPDNS